MTVIAQGFRAPWPVWRESLGAQKAKFIPYPKPKVVRWYHQGLKRLTLWETQRCLTKANGRRTAAHTAKLVLHSLIFDFYNFRTGRLDPSYETIATRAGVGRATVARGLRLLRRLGIIDWIRRCFGYTDKDGRYQLEQDTNAYHLVPPSHAGGLPKDAPPSPTPDTCGAPDPHPALLDFMLAWAPTSPADTPEELEARAALLELEPPNDVLARIKARKLRRDAQDRRNARRPVPKH